MSPAKDTPPEIPGYRLLRELGRGGMGAVYLAEQVALGRQVALKVMHSRNADERSRARFLREAQVMARVEHPYLIGLLDFGVLDSGDLWLALERIEGRSLDQVVEEGPLDPELAAKVMLQVAEALQALHDEGILHRDIKPANIMVEAHRAVLMDLGLVTSSDVTQLTKTGHVLGTPHYLAPEVLVKGTFDERSDWYAWAYTWWELVVGERPLLFQQVLERISAGDLPVLPRPRPTGRDLPPEQVEVIVRTGAAYDQRLRNLAEVRAVLAGEELPGEGRDEGDTQVLPGVPPPQEGATGGADASQEVRPASRRFAVGALVGGGVGALLLGAVLLGWGTPEERAPAPPTGGPRPAPALALDRVLADSRSVVLEGRAADPDAVRVRRVDGGRDQPVAVFPRGPSGYVAWLTGLDPGTTVSLEVRAEGEEPLRRAAATLAAEAPVEERFPEPLRRYLVRPRDSYLRGWLEERRPWVFRAERLKSEADLGTALDLFTEVPHSAWPVLAAWLEEGGVPAMNLSRVLGWAGPRIPGEVSWHWLHRAADPGSPTRVRLEEHEDALLLVRGVRLAPAGYARLQEWYREPARRRRVLQVLAQLSEVLVGVDKWDPPPGWARGLPAVPSDLPELVERARDAAGGDAAARQTLVDGSRGEGSAAAWATALLPALRDRELVPELLGRFAFEEGEGLWAVEAALEALRTEPGFFTVARDGMLLRLRVVDPRLREVVTAEEGPVVLRPEEGLLYGWFERDGAGIELRGPSGARARYEVSASRGFVPDQGP